MKNLKSTSLLFALFAVIYSCGPSNSTNVSTNDGSSIEKAIKVKSVSEEYTIVRKLCPDCKLVSQGLTSKGNLHYDHLVFAKANGEKVNYYFDINSFYGKW